MKACGFYLLDSSEKTTCLWASPRLLLAIQNLPTLSSRLLKSELKSLAHVEHKEFIGFFGLVFLFQGRAKSLR